MGEQAKSVDAAVAGASDENGGSSGDHRQDVVTITINNNINNINNNQQPYSIHRGRQTVSAIKTLGGVPQADELAQVIEGNSPPLTPLADNGSVTIKGGEVFVSYPKDSGSSD
ncbi:MAG: hypothetical protein ACREOJ_12585 [Gemmatimonadaceae bacterium]